MKKLSCFFLLILLSLISCSDNEIDFLDQSIDPIENESEDPTEEDVITDTTIPCDSNFIDMQSNSTIVLNCVLDLDGKTINLPSNVTLEYDGGTIINGALNFNQGQIDGRLLNSTLSIEGNDAKIIGDTFKFEPEKWEITEGKVSDALALKNKEVLKGTMEFTKTMGAVNFEIDKMDAYFTVSKEDNFPPKYRMGGIFIPSNFNLLMTDNTHLRVQPNAYTVFNLLIVYNEANVVIRGGHLHGDRDQHIYGENFGGRDGHQDSVLINVYAGVDVLIDGVNMHDSTGDGVLVKSIGFAFNPDYTPSHGIEIVNCIIDKSRRNNISIVNGYDILVEKCQILNAGAETALSEGSNPKVGIDIEAFRTRDDNGELVYYEIAKDITIRNNVERGSVNSAFLVAIGDDTIIEDNVTENGIGFSLATGIKIRNNKITGTSKHLKKAAIGAGLPNTETTYNNEISGNTIKGYRLGVSLYSKEVKIFGNTFENLETGIFVPNEVRDAEIYDNTITSSTNSSSGISAHTASMSNVVIKKNTITVKGKPVSFVNVNIESGEENHEVSVTENTFIASASPLVENSNGITLENNTTID